MDHSKSVIDIYNVETFGWEAAIRGMRNSRQSYDKSDSYWMHDDLGLEHFIIGENDLKLASNLSKAGGAHPKFRRMIHAQMDIYAPLYWWKEFDTYKVGTTANSTSTMYSITKNEFEWNDFAIDDDISEIASRHWISTINDLNDLREKYIESGSNITESYMYWRDIIQILPESYKQLRTVDLNYEVLARIVKERKGHRLREWGMFIDVIRKNLDYADELIFCEEQHE